MALKFLNKKGWHTGSLRNIENVWKAEQKHDAEQKKLEELRKQIQDERERSEFRLLQEQAGLVPKQERLEFLYDSGLAVGKTSGSSSGGGIGVAFKSLEESIPGSTTTSNNNNAPSSSAQQSSVPGALFEDKPHSSNDTWRKLHSDPLLLIRQREQEALARVKNNPVQMAMIRKSVEASKEKEVNHDSREHQKKHSHSKGKHHKHSSKLQSDSENVGGEGERRRKNSDHKHSSFKDVRVEGEKRRKNSDRRCSKYDEHHYKAQADSDGESSERENQKGRNSYRGSKYRERSPHGYPSTKSAKTDFQDAHRKNHGKLMNERYSLEGRTDFDGDRKGREVNSSRGARSYASSESAHYDSNYRRRNVASKLTEEERLAKLREMQVDAELHEEQRWKRLRKAEEDDVREATQTSKLGGRNFLDAAHKSVYGAEKGGSSTIEESVRRRSHYSQGRSEVGDGNAFRR
ncbi:CELL CYCLE CONTROL PROTEIN CWF25 [Salix purpurea]|uniref:CELL CYCLE CONTROL PROTEIN CWF25 n=1 Tax=Salix purpurea TaxID=77065 RepID=A0A9Q0Q5N2_SALPP|nr:CELL CYCLE CONTROL PROTEIN CWF25 [Salix purpurea]